MHVDTPTGMKLRSYSFRPLNTDNCRKNSHMGNEVWLNQLHVSRLINQNNVIL